MKRRTRTPSSASRRRFMSLITAGAAATAIAGMPAGAAPAAPVTPSAKKRTVKVSIHPNAVPRTKDTQDRSSHGE